MSGEEFRAYRMDKGKSIDQVAKELAVSKWLVYSWENGNRPIRECYAKLFCSLYNVDYKVSACVEGRELSPWLFNDYPESVNG